MTIEQARDSINKIDTIEKLTKEVFDGCFNYRTSMINNNFFVLKHKGYVISWDRLFKHLYVTVCGQVIIDEDNGEISDRTKNFILDNIFDMSDDGFYKFYFRKYGYVIDDEKSAMANDVIRHFMDNSAIINDIFVNSNYTSATIVGKKYTNNNEIEYYLSYCDKKVILDIIEMTHIKPQINKPGIIDYENPYHNHPMITSGDIMDCYNEYKDSMMYE